MIVYFFIIIIISLLLVSSFIQYEFFRIEEKMEADEDDDDDDDDDDEIPPCELNSDIAKEGNLHTNTLTSYWKKIINGINSFSTSSIPTHEEEEEEDDYTEVDTCCSDLKPCLHDGENNDTCHAMQNTQKCPTGTTQNKCSDICQKRKKAYQTKITDLYSYYNETVVARINDQVPGIQKMITAKKKQEETIEKSSQHLDNL